MYGFAAGDPINYSDPFGLRACPPDCGWEGDPKNIDREVDRLKSLTDRDRSVLGAAYLGAATLGLSILAATSTTVVAAGTSMPAWPKVIEGSRRLVENVFKGKEKLEELTPEIRESAARFYEKVAENVGGRFAQQAKVFNLERARYLREGGPTPPGTLPEFIKRMSEKQ